MFEAVYIAATGITNQQRRVDTIADNIANVNTTGFKASRLDFKDALYTAGFGPAPAYSPAEDQQKGHGLMVDSITHNFKGGNLVITSEDMDFAIEGDGFFEIADSTGRLLYTRSGNMYISNEPGGMFIVNANGNYVMNSSGQRIQVPEGTVSIECDQDGALVFKRGEDVLGRSSFGIYTFDNKMGLSAAGSSGFEVTAASGEKRPADEVKVHQGALESSNVDLGIEMTRLIRSQRAFSLAARALTTADDMEGIANSMKS